MNFEPLYELKNRLENVAVVGINLAKDDFRLQRAVEQVKEYSTVAKVFKQIYDMGQKLISTDAEDKCDIFLDLLALLDAVLCTQTTTYSGDKPQQIKTIAKNKDYYKELHYSELSPLLYALTETGSGRCEIIENIIENNSKLLNDFRVKNYMIHGLSDKYSEISYIITEELKNNGSKELEKVFYELLPNECLENQVMFVKLFQEDRTIYAKAHSIITDDKIVRLGF